MALLIRAAELQGRLSLPDAIDAVEAGYRGQAKWPEFSLPRQRILAENRRLTIHPGGIPDLGVVGAFLHYVKTSYQDDSQTYEAFPPRVYVAWDSEAAALLAIIVGSLPLLPFDRPGVDFGSETAVTSAVGVRHLARQDSRVMGLFGTGRQARRHLLTICAIRPIEEVRVYSRRPEHRASFCEELQPLTNARLQAVDTPRAVVEGADLVVCATGSNVPVFDGAWLQPGQHVTSVVGSNKELVREGLVPRGRREIDDTTVQRADLIVATLRQQAIQDEQADLYEPVQRGLITWDQVHNLASLVAGEVPGRTTPEQITLFKQNSDQGVGYLALARYVYDLATREGLGTPL
jgi:hypothetical protein